jgi:hypothetical protein
MRNRPILVEPGDRALDDPVLRSQSGTVPALRPRDPRLDVTAAQFAASFARRVGAVSVQAQRAATRPAAPSAHWRDRVDERNQLRDVVAVAASERDCKRRAAPAGDQVVLGTASRAVDGARASPFVPQTPARASCRSPPATSRSTPPPAASSEDLVQPLLDSGLLPLPQPTPVGHPRAAAHLLRQVLPWDPRPQHEEDSGQHRAVIQPLAAGVVVAPLHLRDQRLDQLPQLIRERPLPSSPAFRMRLTTLASLQDLRSLSRKTERPIRCARCVSTEPKRS